MKKEKEKKESFPAIFSLKQSTKQSTADEKRCEKNGNHVHDFD